MTNSHPTPRLASALMLALALAALAVALMAPTQTLAQAHRSSCPDTHAKTRCSPPTCKQSSHKHRRHHAGKCATKHASAKKKSSSQPLAAAQCADGSPPVLTGDGSFACEDGSDPQCENGAIPTPRGKHLVCPVIFQEESSSSEAECEEEEEGTCASASSDSGEAGATGPSPASEACGETSGEGSPPSSQCEAEG